MNRQTLAPSDPSRGAQGARAAHASPGARAAGAAALEILEGVLERVTYANEENAWSVVRLAVSGRAELVTAVGNLLGVQPGESLRLTGRWAVDPRYGEQFRVERYVTVKPATLVGIERYLGSGLVRGIGKQMAQRLVRHFGLATLDVIDASPERLREVDGIGPKRSARIRSAWVEQRDIRQVMLFLQSNGVSSTYAVKIYRQYREHAITTVQENPYRLAIDIHGIGFKTADRIAANLGIAPTSPRRAEAGLLHVLGELSGDGHVYVPREQLLGATVELLGVDEPLVAAALETVTQAGHVVGEALPRGGLGIFLKSLHTAEVGVAQALTELLSCPATPVSIDVPRALAWLEQRSGLALAPEQRDAIARAVTEKVLVITGGPGTGKTTLVNGVIQILEKKGRRILLAAPTGRAAKRLMETTGREAKTVHRLLEFNPRGGGFERGREKPLEADVVIVDESSMLDVALAYSVLKAVPPRAQLVLVGDVDQLPSVGPGRVLADVIASGAVPVVRLQRIFRQARASVIVTNAHRVNAGQFPELRDERDRCDFVFVERQEPEEVLAAVKAWVGERLPRERGFDAFDAVQVLTPMHRGTLGAANLNAELQALLNPLGASIARGGRLFRVGDKVMQLRNNYELDVYNGDIGRVTGVDEIEHALEVTFDGRPVTYDTGDLDELALSYACSIHKSQGSEYPCVVLPLHTQHYVMLQRNLLYTALTRGKRLVVLVGSKRAVALAVKNASTGERFTRLAERLSSRAHA